MRDMTRGFPTVSLSDAEPAWQGWREGTEASRGTMSRGKNKVDNQTAVLDRYPYMLYSDPSTESVKQESEALPTETGGDGKYMCYDGRERRHSVQGSMV